MFGLSQSIVSKRKETSLGTHQIVHALLSGKALCRFSNKSPADWPKGHAHVRINSTSEITCNQCQDARTKLAAKRTNPPPSKPVIEHFLDVSAPKESRCRARLKDNPLFNAYGPTTRIAIQNLLAVLGEHRLPSHHSDYMPVKRSPQKESSLASS